MSTCVVDASSDSSTAYTCGPGQRLESIKWQPLRCTSVRPARTRATRRPPPCGAPPWVTSMRSMSAFRRDRRDRSGVASLPIAPRRPESPPMPGTAHFRTDLRLLAARRRPHGPRGPHRAGRFTRTTQTDHASGTSRRGCWLCGQGLLTRPPSRIVRSARGRLAEGVATTDAHRVGRTARAASQSHPS